MKAGRPSSTARLIARSMVLLSLESDHEDLVSPETAGWSRLFLHEFESGRDRLLAWMGRPWFRRLIWMVESWILPGIFQHYALRKKEIRKIVEESLREGFSQIVVLGAGYDTLCLQIRDGSPAIQCIEYDHPATQGVKVKALQKAGVSQDRIKFVPCDLQSLSFRDLQSASTLLWDQPTVIVAEGLLMYFSESAVRSLFDTLSNFFRGKSRIVFTFLEPDVSGRADFQRRSILLRLWLRWKGEVFDWGCSFLTIFDFLDQSGFDGVARFDPSDREADAFLSLSHRIGEFICVADRRWGGSP